MTTLNERREVLGPVPKVQQRTKIQKHKNTIPHPPFGHLLPLYETGEGYYISILPQFLWEKVADRPDEGGDALDNQTFSVIPAFALTDAHIFFVRSAAI